MSITAKDVYHYKVNLLFVPVLDLKMQTQEYGNNCKKLEFRASTNSFFDNVYQVNNYYQCVYSKKSYLPQFRSKKIHQPNLDQEISTKYTNHTAQYSNGKKVHLTSGTHSFFSMLMYLRSLEAPYRNKTVTLELEGKIYSVNFQKTGSKTFKINNKKIPTDIIEIELKHKATNNPILKDSDVFFNNVANPKGKRLVWIENGGKKRIIQAKFSIKGTWLVAKLRGG
ncbi:MAG: DUF3108 domain-containing protein [Candidatus Marinimicrobia bacterium]|nr:DUF3108 domain-containing protein [Candidatus Neomarinimicrobiota bacterium]